MSGIGFSELIILFVIGLIVLGPERLPRVANQLGGWIGQARRMTRIMKQQLEDELDLKKEFNIQPPALQAPRNVDKVSSGNGDAIEPASGGTVEQSTDKQSAKQTTAKPKAKAKAKNRNKKNNEMTGGKRDG